MDGSKDLTGDKAPRPSATQPPVSQLYSRYIVTCMSCAERTYVHRRVPWSAQPLSTEGERDPTSGTHTQQRRNIERSPRAYDFFVYLPSPCTSVHIFPCYSLAAQLLISPTQAAASPALPSQLHNILTSLQRIVLARFSAQKHDLHESPSILRRAG